MQKTAGRPPFRQSAEQLGGQSTFGRPHGLGVPLCPLAVNARDKGRLPAHGQTNITGCERLVDLSTQFEHLSPLRLGVGFGDPRRFVETLHPHTVIERHLTFFDRTLDRRCPRRAWRSGQWHMPLTREQPRRRIEADPSGTRQIHLAPRMQIREIVFGARRTVDRLLIGFELNQITRDKPGRHPQSAQRLNHQPGRIPTRTRTEH